MIHLRITLEDDTTGATATAEIPTAFGPALRSAIEDISNTIGGRLVSDLKFSLEDALTEAAMALAPLRVAINQIVPEGHEDYE
jgi:hypothetical protein